MLSQFSKYSIAVWIVPCTALQIAPMLHMQSDTGHTTHNVPRATLDATGTESPIGSMCAADVEELNALHLMVSDTSTEYQLRYAEVRSAVWSGYIYYGILAAYPSTPCGSGLLQACA